MVSGLKAVFHSSPPTNQLIGVAEVELGEDGTPWMTLKADDMAVDSDVILPPTVDMRPQGLFFPQRRTLPW